MCGFLGIIGQNGDVAQELYSGLVALQHRGQDAAGIITYDGTFHLKKGVGLVLGVFNEKNLARLKGPMGLGHVRYPTIGPGGSEDAQPFSVNTPLRIVMAHNGNLSNYQELRQQLAEESRRYMSSQERISPGSALSSSSGRWPGSSTGLRGLIRWWRCLPIMGF